MDSVRPVCAGWKSYDIVGPTALRLHGDRCSYSYSTFLSKLTAATLDYNNVLPPDGYIVHCVPVMSSDLVVRTPAWHAIVRGQFSSASLWSPRTPAEPGCIILGVKTWLSSTFNIRDSASLMWRNSSVVGASFRNLDKFV